jgi:DNA processing protein
MSTFSYSEFYQSLTPTERKYAPAQLFVEGDATLLSGGLKVSIVGTRKPSEQGIRDAECLAKTLVEHGVIVVSGLAEGIDTAAHETAIRSGGKTIAVLGTPLEIAYPVKNKALLDTIKTHHLAVSQFAPDYPTTPGNFPMRNRTMALLSDATIIVEATENSGTKHQGWEALRLGRLIFILRSVLDNPALSWPREMVKYGAQELTCDMLPAYLEAIPNVTSRSDHATLY